MTNKIKGLTEKEKKAIAEFEASLLKRFPDKIRQLILFGSKARGDSHRHSDIDLLVLLSKNNRHIRKGIISLVHEPIARFGVELSPILAEEKEFKGWSPFFAHVKKEGISLWKSAENS